MAVGGRVIKFMATIHVPHLVQIYEYPLPDATEELARLPTAHSSADFHSGRVQCVARSGGESVVARAGSTRREAPTGGGEGVECCRRRVSCV